MKSVRELFDLTGKYAVVTGASSGLGVTMAQGLAAAGAHVVVAARRKDRLAEVVAQIEAQGGKATAVECNVVKSEQVEALMANAMEKCGRIDVLVNNAGVVRELGMVPEKVSDKAFEITVKVNLMGLWYCCREGGARMLADGRGGSIINIASCEGISGERDGPPAYQATKAAVINLTRNLAASWGDRGVRVNAIAPGWFPSEMTGWVYGSAEFEQFFASQSPMGRTGKPEELVGPLLLLASDAGSFITGQTLVVDGGLTATFGSLPRPEAFAKMAADMTPEGRGRRIEPQD